MALVALLHLSDGQIRMQPVKLFWLDVLQQETVASYMYDVRAQSTRDQNRTYDGLKETKLKKMFLNIVYFLSPFQLLHFVVASSLRVRANKLSVKEMLKFF